MPFDIITKPVPGLYSFMKSTSKNMSGKKLNDYDLIDGGLSLLDKNIKKGISTMTSSGITLTNNEIKDIMKVIKSLENRGNLLKRAIRKITSQEGGFLNFFRPLMTAGLSLMKSVFTPLAKSVLLPLGLSEAAVQKKIYGSETTALII